MEQHIQRYEKYIKEDLSGIVIDTATYKENLHKSFEWYACIQLSLQYKSIFLRWEDVPPQLREEKGMPRDMGIDAWDIEGNRVSQMKLYQGCISWRNFSTFLSCCDVFENPLKILYRTEQSTICDMIKFRITKKIITDITVADSTFREECKRIQTLTVLSDILPEATVLRPYQIESITYLEKGADTKRNVYLCEPTGCGKTLILLQYHSIHRSEILLVLVPRVVLMEQWGEECMKHGIKPYLIGTGQHHNMEKFKEESIVICVYDSFPNIYEHKDIFQRYCIDEAHHIKTPERYMDTEAEHEVYHDSDNETDDEMDDEIKEEPLSYMECIQSLSDTKRVIYLSATLDRPEDDSLFYEYKIRKAIDDGYLCDYQFVFPIFEQENVTNENLAHYLVHKQHESHCVIYARNCKEGQEFTDMLNQLQKGCAGYIDADTSYKERKRLFVDFESGKIKFLVNIRILVEGFNAPHIRSIFFLHVSTWIIFIIQAIGRALRIHQDKLIATIYVPFTQESDFERIQTFIHQLSTYDERIKQTISEKKIGGYLSIENGEDMNDNEEDEKDDTVDVFDFRYNLIVNSMGNGDMMVEILEKKANMLLDFVIREKRVPKFSELVGDFKIGIFWTSIKQGRNYDIYQSHLSTNAILSADYERVQKIKDEKRDKKKMRVEEKANMLLTFVNDKKRVPKFSEVVEDFKIGIFWDKIKQGGYRNIYQSHLSTNVILSADYERVQKIKDEKQDKEEMSMEEKANMLLTFVNSEKRLPKKSDVVDEFKIGEWWHRIKQGGSPHIYQSHLSTNVILSADYERVQKIKEEKQDKEEMSMEEKANMLLTFVNSEKRLPKATEEVDGFKTGAWWNRIKQGGTPDIYLSQLSTNTILSADYNKTQKIKEDKQGEEMSKEEKANMLLTFVNSEKRVPKATQEVDGFKIGSFWGNIKQGGSPDIYQSHLSANAILSADYNKTQKIKEEKKGKKEMSMEDKAKALLGFVIREKRVPKQSEEVDGFKTGAWWNRIKQGGTPDIYQSHLSANAILSADYDMVQKIKDEKQGKEEMSKEEKANMLLTFVNSEKRVPKATEEVDGFKIGIFWGNIKRRCPDIYQSHLSISPILSADYDKVQKIKDDKKEKKEMSVEEKASMLLSFVKREERVPKKCEVVDEFNIGSFWHSIKQLMNSGIYLSHLSKNAILSDDYERVQKIKLDKQCNNTKSIE
jgi:superfamily II DNA or RNA helicase